MASNAWGDAVDDEKYLPPSTVSGPDKNGIKTYTEYKFNNKKQKIKVIRRVKVQTKSRKVSRLIAERKQWLHFGAAKGKPQGKTKTKQIQPRIQVLARICCMHQTGVGGQKTYQKALKNCTFPSRSLHKMHKKINMHLKLVIKTWLKN